MIIGKNFGTSIITKPVKEGQPRFNSKNNNLVQDVFERQNTLSFDDSYYALFEEMMQKAINKTASIMNDYVREYQFGVYLTALSNRSVRKKLNCNKSNKIEDVNYSILRGTGADVEAINKIMNDAGIKTIMQLEHFVNLYNRNSDISKVFKTQAVEAVKIYGILNSKEDFAKYPELLLYLYNEEQSSDNPDFSKLNRKTEFLRQININNLKDFDVKFAHLKEYFNDFESISDKADAIDYLQSTYDDKIELINYSLVDLNTHVKPSKVYQSAPDIIDYLYIKNDGEYLEPLDDILDGVLNIGKVKPQVLRKLSECMVGLNTPNDKVEFYLLLNECNTVASELNELLGKTVVSDVDSLDVILNREYITHQISDLKGVSQSDAAKIYTNMSDIFNALYDPNSEDSFSIETLVDIFDKYNTNNSYQLLDFYNKASGERKKSVKQAELKEFFSLLEYTNSASLLADAKAKGMLAVQLLKQEKAKFEAVEPIIINAMVNNDAIYFAGKSPLQIYFDCKDLIDENPDNLTGILNDIKTFNLSSSAEYKQKTEELNKFAKYFEDRESLIKFVSNNGIKLDSSAESCTYREACLEIFEAVSGNTDAIKYYAESGFLEKSKIFLPEFFKVFPDKQEQTQILTVISDKKIPTLDALNKFLREYKSQSNDYKNLITHLESLPEGMSFSQSLLVLKNIQSKIKELNIPVEINNTNILSVDFSKLKPKKDLSTQETISLLNQLLNVPSGKNFISKLPNALTDTNKTYSRFRIAKEIVDKLYLTDESYNNIASLFKLDRQNLGLNEECSDIMYQKMVEQTLPNEFINFINSPVWLSEDAKGSNFYNISLHAKLRLIDRFFLNNVKSVDELYTKETNDKLKELFDKIYNENPTNLKGTDESHRIITNFKYNDEIIEAVFSNRGEMITIVPKKNYSSSI